MADTTTERLIACDPGFACKGCGQRATLSLQRFVPDKGEGRWQGQAVYCDECAPAGVEESEEGGDPPTADYANQLVPQLREECKRRGIPASGTKDVLCQRLTSHDGAQGNDQEDDDNDNYDDCSDELLSQHATSEGVDSSGTREELIARLREHDRN